MRTTMFLADATDAIMGMGIFGIIGLVIVGLFYALFPLIVMAQLRGLKLRFDQSNKNTIKLLDQITRGDAANIESQTEIWREIKSQNELSRQLLRAYGHEPEA